MNSEKKTSNTKSRANVRFDPDIWAKVDQSRNTRVGFVSRNSWILEAVIEKLTKEGVVVQSSSVVGDA